MKTIEINQKEENGHTVYEFSSRGTDYSVMTKDGKEFEVWSQRSHMRHPSVSCFNTMEDLANRSKVLKQLSILLAA